MDSCALSPTASLLFKQQAKQSYCRFIFFLISENQREAENIIQPK